MNRRVAVLLIPVALVALAGLALGAKPSKRLSDDARGQELYERHCIQCHGAGGAGDGPASAAMVARVPDLRGKLDSPDVETLGRLVLDGKGAMPGFEMSFDRYDANRTVRYFAKISRDPTKAAQAPVPATPPKDTGKPAPGGGEEE
jgi:mono/diheme cytochrome c family protein